MIAAGDFRNDLYQRVCTVEIKPPTLHAQLADKPSDLGLMALHIAVKLHGPDEGAALAERAMPTLLRKLRSSYAWPGNFRELERLVHRSLVQSTAPSTRRPTDTPVTGLVDAIAAGHTTWDAFERQVVAEVFARTNSVRKGAEMLGMSRERFKGLLQKSERDAPRKKPPRGERTGQRGASRGGAGVAPGGDPTAGASRGTADGSTMPRS
jgi:two-component system NtrC family response regulator